MDDERDLDQLIDNVFTEEDAAPEPEAADPPDDDPADTGEPDGAEADFDDEAPALDEDLSDEEEAPLLPAESTPDPPAPQPGPDPSFLALQQQHQQQQQLLQQYIQREQAAKFQQQLAGLRAQWEQMEPDDAHRAELEFVASMHQGHAQQLQQQLATLQQQQAAQAADAEDREAKPAAIGRAISHYKLREEDRARLDEAATAEELDLMARTIQAERQRSTERARAAKAERLKANPALAGGSGGKAATPSQAPPTDIDDYLNQLFD